MRQLMDFLEIRIGEVGLIIVIGLILAGSGLAFLVFTIRNNPGLVRTLAISVMLISGLAFAWQLKIPVERIHILEYGILGWFAGRDLVKKEKKIWGILLALIFVAFFGVLDEAFQAILPYRFFDLRDIGFNELGGVCGIVLYLLGTVPFGDSPFNKR
jgi:hypothetical protein